MVIKMRNFNLEKVCNSLYTNNEKLGKILNIIHFVFSSKMFDTKLNKVFNDL